jgi:hypothetical protein
MIEIELLEIRCGTKAVQKKSETIFERPSSHTVLSNYFGAVKINNFNDEGREFIQEFFYANHSFGEPPLFLE